MKNDLFIGATQRTEGGYNSSLKDAYTEFGVCMGDGFLDALNAPVGLKDFVTNESRLIHGRSVVIDKEYIRKDFRELNLSFTLNASEGTLEEMRSDLRSKRDNFLDLLYGVEVDIYIPKESTGRCFHLLYKGKSATHSYNFGRTACVITCKFEESDPSDRKVPLNPPTLK